MITTHSLGSYNVSKQQLTEMVKFRASGVGDGKQMKKPSHGTEMTNEVTLLKRENREKRRKEPKKTESNESGKLDFAEYYNEDDEEEIEKQCLKLEFCCPRSTTDVKYTTSATGAVFLWQRKHCKTFAEFLELLKLTTRNAVNCLATIKETTRRLCVTNDRSSEFYKLSALGGPLWILTYSIQYLVDPSKLEKGERYYYNTNPELEQGAESISRLLKELAREVQAMVLRSEEFLNSTRDLRENGAEIMRRIQKQFKLSRDPFLLHPEINKRYLRPRHPTAAGALSAETLMKRRISDMSDHDEFFEVQWSPLTVFYQGNSGASWDPFESASISTRIRIIETFLKDPIRLLQGFALKLGISDKLLNKVEQPGQLRSSNLLELTSGMLSFISTYDRSRDTSEESKDLIHVQETAEAFWFTLDTLNNAAFSLARILRESRDVVRTCYVYIINFYQWNLSSFSSFDPRHGDKEAEERRKRASRFVDKVLGKRKFSDVALFLSLTDFTMSPYKDLLRHHPVSCDGKALKLEEWEDG